MKKLFAILLALILALSLVACGSKKKSSDVSVTLPTNSATETPEDESERLPLTSLQPFSENRAWITFETTDPATNQKVSRTAVIDEKGNIITTLDDTPSYCAPFTDGVSFYLKSDKDFTIIDESGKVLYKNDSAATAPLQFLGYGNGHFLVVKYESSFDSTAWMIGTIDKNGNIKNEFKKVTEQGKYAPKENMFDGFIYDLYKDGYNGGDSSGVEYLGENIMALDRRYAAFYNLATGELKYRSYVDVVSKFADGKMLVNYDYHTYDDGENLGYVFIGSDLNLDGLKNLPKLKITINDPRTISNNTYDEFARSNVFSEGLLYGQLADAPFTKGYFDASGKLAIAPNFLDGHDFVGGLFSDGYAPILTKGADSKTYLTIIDKSGNKQYELLAVDKCNILHSANGYVEATVSGKTVIIDPKGNIKTAGADDLSGIGNASFGNVSGGFFIIDKTYVSLDGKTVIKDIVEK